MFYPNIGILHNDSKESRLHRMAMLIYERPIAEYPNRINEVARLAAPGHDARCVPKRVITFGRAPLTGRDLDSIHSVTGFHRDNVESVTYDNNGHPIDNPVNLAASRVVIPSAYFMEGSLHPLVNVVECTIQLDAIRRELINLGLAV